VTTAGADSFVATVCDASAVYGEDGVALDDPAEAFHEASKLYPSTIARQVSGSLRLTTSADLQATARRAVRRNRSRAALSLPRPVLPAVTLAEVLEARRSERDFGAGPVALKELTAILHAGYGVTRGGSADDPQPLRAVPSGGALYPLEVYVAVARVDGVEPGLYHFDPLRHVLEVRRPTAPLSDVLREAAIYPEIATACAATLLVTGVFWRSRFKYGLRGYRFALLEAGHLAQNVLLACAALGLAAVPLGGFYDRPLDELLGADGVNESMVYAVCLGRRPAAGEP
jgi:SagB-type dehydrogenase family enzyme